jgi:hypothetical protein
MTLAEMMNAANNPLSKRRGSKWYWSQTARAPDGGAGQLFLTLVSVTLSNASGANPVS